MSDDSILNVLRIVDGTTVDGPHFRTSIYLAGCNHRCHGCHNPQSWDEASGISMTIGHIMQRIRDNGLPVTLTGGDPMMNPGQLAPLLRRLREEGYNVWLYTGYLFEDLLNDPDRSPLLPLIDVIVDGPFVMHLRDTRLLFRGSSNQRLIDVSATLTSGTVTEWHDTF